MTKQLATLSLALAAGLANAQGLGWKEMPQGIPNGAVYATRTETIAGVLQIGQTNGVVIVNGQTGNAEGGCYLFNSGGSRSVGGANKWCMASGTSGWAVYQFANGDRWALTNYAFKCTTDNVSYRPPAVWRIEGSNNLQGNTPAAVNAATWEVVDARAYPGSIGAGWHSFDCAENETAYNAYRLNVLQNAAAVIGANHNVIELHQWHLFGNSGSAQLWQNPATGVGHFSATLNGWFDKHVNRAFDFWVVCDTVDRGVNFTSWQLAGAATKVSDPGDGPFSVTLHNLAPRQPHYARFYAVSGNAQAWSTPVYFVTEDTTPAVLSLPPANVTVSSATALGNLVYADGGSADIRLFWGLQNGVETGVWEHEEFLSNQPWPEGPVDFALSGLAINTMYYYLFTASNATGCAA